MLDKASLENLARTPEKNAPLLNVALAEEGPIDVLVALCRSQAVGPEALSVVAARIAKEGPFVGVEREARGDEPEPRADELDRLLVVHERAPDDVRDEVVARHATDPFFVLAAACHARATLRAIERAVDWAPASPVHDRLWLALLDPSLVPPLVLEEWAGDRASALRREAAARIAREPSILEGLASDSSRQVRRALASNRAAVAERARLAEHDAAPEVRARAQGPSSPAVPHEHGARLLESARFAAALRALESGGVLAPDVLRALSGPELDPEGAMLAAIVLPRKELTELVDRVIEEGPQSARGSGFAAGLALRPAVALGAGDDAAEGELTDIVYDALKTLARTTTAESRLTGKARLAAWLSEGLGRSGLAEPSRVVELLAKRPMAAERMVLARGAQLDRGLVARLVEGCKDREVPGALLELAWADASVPDARMTELAARVAKPKKRAEDLPDDEVDLDPSLRSLDVLEKTTLATTPRANVAPRAALAVTALDARRVRYVLAAMPQWKGRLTGGRLARVLRQNAGAISAGQLEARARGSKIEGWTERLMSESELAIALAVGHVTGAEVARRIASGRQQVDDGLSLAFGAEARAALEGVASAMPIVEWATKNRTTSAPALALWMLLEKLDRERGPTLIAASIDAHAAGKGAMPAGVVDALATMEHRRPGRLETIFPQSPRGRATLASAIARAYRAVGGMRDERQGP